MARTDLMYTPAASSSRSAPGSFASAANTSPKRPAKRVKPTLKVTTQFAPAPHRLKPHEPIPWAPDALSQYVHKWSRDFQRSAVLSGVILDNSLSLHKVIRLHEGMIEELAHCRKDIEADIRLLIRKFRGIVHDSAIDVPSETRTSPEQSSNLSTSSTSQHRTPEVVTDIAQEADVPLPTVYADTDPTSPAADTEPSAPVETVEVHDTADAREDAAVGQDASGNDLIAVLLGTGLNATANSSVAEIIDEAAAAAPEDVNDLDMPPLDLPQVTYVDVGVQTEPIADIIAHQKDDLREALSMLDVALECLAGSSSASEDPDASLVVDLHVFSPAGTRSEGAIDRVSVTNTFLRPRDEVSVSEPGGDTKEEDEEDMSLATVQATLANGKTSHEDSPAPPHYSSASESDSIPVEVSPTYDPPPYISSCAPEDVYDDEEEQYYREVPIEIPDADADSWELDAFAADELIDLEAGPEPHADVPIISPATQNDFLPLSILSPWRPLHPPPTEYEQHGSSIPETGRRMHWVAVPSPPGPFTSLSSSRHGRNTLSPLAMSSGLPTFELPDAPHTFELHERTPAHAEFTPALTVGGSALSTPARGHGTLTPGREYSPLLRGAGVFDSFNHDVERHAGRERNSPRERESAHSPWQGWSIGGLLQKLT